jgi:hypothetical protein
MYGDVLSKRSLQEPGFSQHPEIYVSRNPDFKNHETSTFKEFRSNEIF